MYYDDEAYAFARQDSQETVIVVINRAMSEKQIRIPAESIRVQNGSQLVALYGEKTSGKVAAGEISLSMPGRTAVIYKVE